MSATLGGLIKDYRQQKNLSQLEIAFAMGWKEPSRLSRIEQGHHVKPKRSLMDKLVKSMQLSETEKNNILLAGNYLPTEEEVTEIRKRLEEEFKEWKYPIIAYDFSLRIIYTNKIFDDFYRYDELMKYDVSKKMPNIFEITFSPNYPPLIRFKDKELEQYITFLKNCIIQFKINMKESTTEKWYIDTLKKLMNIDLFRKLWSETQIVTQTELTDYLFEPATPYKEPSKKVNFHLFLQPVLTDPRFSIDFHIPADIETFKYFSK